jgi:WD40 repeat protein
MAVALGNGAAVYDRRTGRSSPTWPQADVRTVALHPAGSPVAAFSYGAKGFVVREVPGGEVVFAHPIGNQWSGRFTADGTHLVAFGNDGPDLLVWSVPDGRLVRRLGLGGVFAISPDVPARRFVAVAESNGKVRLTRLADGENLARFDAPGQDYLRDLEFSPDGRFLLGLNVDRNRVHVWDLWALRAHLRELRLDWEPDPPPVPDADPPPISVWVTPQTWWGPFVGALGSGK